MQPDQQAVQHTDLPPDSRRATASDRRAASDARARVAEHLLGPAATAHRNTVGGRLIWCDPACGGCGSNAMEDDPDATRRLPTGQRATPQWRLCNCPTSALQPNEPGIRLLTDSPEWAGVDVLKALAVCEGVDLAIIDHSRAPADRTMVYPADGEHQTRFFSWASSLAPRLRKQHAGMELGIDLHGQRRGIRRPVAYDG